MDDLLTFFFSSRFLMALLGGIGAYLMQCGYLSVGRTPTQKPRFIQGSVYAFFSATAGLCLINPPTPVNAFFVGLVGVIAMWHAHNSFRLPAISDAAKQESLAPSIIENNQPVDAR